MNPPESHDHPCDEGFHSSEAPEPWLSVYEEDSLMLPHVYGDEEVAVLLRAYREGWVSDVEVAQFDEKFEIVLEQLEDAVVRRGGEVRTVFRGLGIIQ